jgi:hypothetical protein
MPVDGPSNVAPAGFDLSMVMMKASLAMMDAQEKRISLQANLVEQSAGKITNYNKLAGALSSMAANLKTAKPDEEIGEKNLGANKDLLAKIGQYAEAAGVDMKTLFSPTGVIDKTTTLNQLTTAASSVRQTADTQSSQSQRDSLALQQLTNKHQQNIEAATATERTLSQSKMSIVKNF